MANLERGEVDIFIGGKVRRFIMRNGAIRRYEQLSDETLIKLMKRIQHTQTMTMTEVCHLIEAGLVHTRDKTIDADTVDEWIDNLPTLDPPENGEDNFKTLVAKLMEAVASGAPGKLTKKETPEDKKEEQPTANPQPTAPATTTSETML